MANIHDLMERWGAWAASDSCGVDWKPIAAGFKSLIPYGKKSRVQCTDDEGLLIDSLVTKLCRRRPEMYEVLIAHFVMGISLRAIARRLKCSDGTIRKKLESALAFVEGGLVSTQNV
ncbi:antitermination protein [Enterobacter ludwigii]|nr:antitermination protein [Enterobacter ludwigii]